MTKVKKAKGVSYIYNQDVIKLHAIKSNALDVSCYRGFAKLCDLAIISRADEYNEITHPEGIQRNLNKKHAKEVYEYAAQEKPGVKRIWPEIILSMRYKKGVKIDHKSSFKGDKDMQPVAIKINTSQIALNDKDPSFSRVDGNHRLFYANGFDKKKPALKTITPFCIIENLSREQEIEIFRTINFEQKSLSTDHLLRITGQTFRGIELMKKDPVLWLTEQLRDNKESPFYQVVHIAGVKDKGSAYIIKQKSLNDGIKVLYKALDDYLKKDIESLKPLSKLIILFFSAVEKRWKKEWNDSKKYLLMTNTGMQALGAVGAQLIERQVKKQKKLTVDDFLQELKTVQFSWEKGQGSTKLATGRPGAEIIKIRILESMQSTTIDLSKVV